jgi:hypothetical protein
MILGDNDIMAILINSGGFDAGGTSYASNVNDINSTMSMLAPELGAEHARSVALKGLHEQMGINNNPLALSLTLASETIGKVEDDGLGDHYVNSAQLLTGQAPEKSQPNLPPRGGSQ